MPPDRAGSVARSEDVEVAQGNVAADDAHNVEAILRKHVHATDGHLAAGDGAHHQHPRCQFAAGAASSHIGAADTAHRS